MTRRIKIGIIGLGARTETLLASIFALHDEAEVTAICDLSSAAIEKINGIFRKNDRKEPKAFTNYHDLLNTDVEAVLVPTSWNSHLPIACDVMKSGKYVGIEVGGAASLDELWHLVHASEETKTPCMMLENCCYGRNELLLMNMVRQGVLGELVYCECGYEHDLRTEIMPWLEKDVERALHNLHRNGDLYPTHGLGPIAKILDINCGNRFVSLVSMSSQAVGFREAALAYFRDRSCKHHFNFKIGDVVTTLIKCANGQTISLVHCISLPRPYSRNCRVQGTKGLWLEDANAIHVEGISPSEELLDAAANPYWTHSWDPMEKFYAQYEHPIWQGYDPVGGHSGMDALALRAFFHAVREKETTPIDVYDCASWMSVTCLSEQSIALGSAPVAFPDFTNGKWINRSASPRNTWTLNRD